MPDAEPCSITMAWLDPDGVSKDFARELGASIPGVSALAASESRFDEAVEALRCFSLVEHDGGQLHVHRLVQAVVRTCDESASVEAAVVEALRARFDFDPGRSRVSEASKEAARHTLHAMSVRTHPSREDAWALHQVACFWEAPGVLALQRQAASHMRSVAQRLADADPHSAQAQRDLSVSLDRLGDVEMHAGDLAAARQHFAASLEACKRLADADPRSAQAQRDLIVSWWRLGLATKDASHFERALVSTRTLQDAGRLDTVPRVRTNHQFTILGELPI